MDKPSRTLDRGIRNELQQEMDRHHQEVLQVAVLPDAHWVIQLIAEDERHYTRMLRMLKAFRATHPPGDGKSDDSA